MFYASLYSRIIALALFYASLYGRIIALALSGIAMPCAAATMFLAVTFVRSLRHSLFRVDVVSRPALAFAFAALHLHGLSSRPSHITMVTPSRACEPRLTQIYW